MFILHVLQTGINSGTSGDNFRGVCCVSEAELRVDSPAVPAGLPRKQSLANDRAFCPGTYGHSITFQSGEIANLVYQ